MTKVKPENRTQLTKLRKVVSIAERRFANLLAELLAQRGWENIDLANATGLSRQSIFKYVRGEMQPTWHSVQIIAEALEVDVSVLFDLPKPSEITRKHLKM